MSGNSNRATTATMPFPQNGVDMASVEVLKRNFQDHLKYTLAKDEYSATDYDRYYALSMACATG